MQRDRERDSLCRNIDRGGVYVERKRERVYVER